MTEKNVGYKERMTSNLQNLKRIFNDTQQVQDVDVLSQQRLPDRYNKMQGKGKVKGKVLVVVMVLWKSKRQG